MEVEGLSGAGLHEEGGRALTGCGFVGNAKWEDDDDDDDDDDEAQEIELEEEV